MKVYKFGGASVRNADGVRNLRHIVDGEDNLFIIVSAMGKTTNALERVFTHMKNVEKEAANEEIKQIQEYHASIIDELWGEHTDINEVTLLFGQLRNIVNDIVYRPSDAELWYDTIVSFGELISTTIISKYLNHTGLRNRWIDMRTTFITRCTELGIPEFVIQSWVGHKIGSKVTKDSYTTHNTEIDNKYINILNQSKLYTNCTHKK